MQYGPYAGVTVSLSSRPGGFRVEDTGQALRVELGWLIVSSAIEAESWG
jgi:hypothetical protein